MIAVQSPRKDSCEKHPRFSSISSSAKVRIFRKSRKHFVIILHLRKKIDVPQFSRFLQNVQNEALAKISFFANVLPLFLGVNKSKNAPPQSHHGYLYWLFLLNRRNIFYAGIALRAKRIDIHPVFTSDYNL